MLFLLNATFPLFGSKTNLGMLIISFPYFILVIYRFYKFFKTSIKDDRLAANNNILLTGVIEGFFLWAFIILKGNSNLPLSNLIFAYVLIQTIRFQNRNKIFLILISIAMEGYLYFISERAMENLIYFFSNSGLIFFIALSLNIVFSELARLQTDKEYYLNELKTSNDKLVLLASTDYLTGLYNHKTFYLKINDFYTGSDNRYNSLCMALIDIDDFKTINDSYGHLAGDAVLTGLASIMKECIRKNDFAARYGGEEFVILFPKTNLKLAEEICERLRNKIEKEVFEIDNRTLKITVSI